TVAIFLFILFYSLGIHRIRDNGNDSKVQHAAFKKKQKRTIDAKFTKFIRKIIACTSLFLLQWKQ
ncbi:hypothetical protein, partial [Streptococcus danieliae]|uniref:hypothetical protein n=1 Tax=Streptococcus danieliae TaxID=747656 RepID=UPI0021C78042